MRNILILIAIGLLVTFWLAYKDTNYKYQIVKADYENCRDQSYTLGKQAESNAEDKILNNVDTRFSYCFDEAKIINYTWQEARYMGFVMCTLNYR